MLYMKNFALALFRLILLEFYCVCSSGKVALYTIYKVLEGQNTVVRGAHRPRPRISPNPDQNSLIRLSVQGVVSLSKMGLSAYQTPK